MSIISIPFILFAIVFVLIYFWVPKRWQWSILLAANLVFYLSGGWQGMFYILITIVSQYFLALALERRNEDQVKQLAKKELDNQQRKQIKQKEILHKRRLLLLAVVLNIGILCVLKYTNPAIETLNHLFGLQARKIDILIPIGLSYYTFKSVGYVIDVYRGRIKAQKNIFKLALYISYFPALVQGPIDRYEDLADQLFAEHRFSYQRLCFGAQRMLWGYIKKLVIAERCAVIVGEIMGFYAAKGYEGFIVFFGVALQSFQVYADFSGGMDIVLGLSEICGISMTENFRHPFFAVNLAEFWRRWHITLGAWMRTYVFYPLSMSPAFNKLGKKCRKIFGDKTGKLIAPSLASFITFVLIGIWHGVGWKYVAYGFYLAFFVATATLLEDFYASGRALFRIQEDSKGWRVFRFLRTFFVVTMGKYLSQAKNLADTGGLLKATFTNFNLWVFFDGSFYRLGLDRPNFILMLVSIFILLYVDYLQEKGVHIRETIAGKSIILRWGGYYAAIFVLLIFGMYGPDYNAASFIYQRF